MSSKNKYLLKADTKTLGQVLLLRCFPGGAGAESNTLSAFCCFGDKKWPGTKRSVDIVSIFENVNNLPFDINCLGPLRGGDSVINTRIYIF